MRRLFTWWLVPLSWDFLNVKPKLSQQDFFSFWLKNLNGTHLFPPHWECHSAKASIKALRPQITVFSGQWNVIESQMCYFSTAAGQQGGLWDLASLQRVCTSSRFLGNGKVGDRNVREEGLENWGERELRRTWVWVKTELALGARFWEPLVALSYFLPCQSNPAVTLVRDYGGNYGDFSKKFRIGPFHKFW